MNQFNQALVTVALLVVVLLLILAVLRFLGQV